MSLDELAEDTGATASVVEQRTTTSELNIDDKLGMPLDSLIDPGATPYATQAGGRTTSFAGATQVDGREQLRASRVRSVSSDSMSDSDSKGRSRKHVASRRPETSPPPLPPG